ncbi:MAG: NUMOD4 motif-containing HNH endonuclease [Treponema sp.]|nr:NUMOD4 motif-containing HNH endonuclease [Treponema sp.]
MNISVFCYENKERWIPFGDGRYSVSDLGRIRNNLTGVIRRQFYDKDGYPKIKLYAGAGKRIANRINVLVATYHIRQPLAGEEADHIDGRRDNNAAHNLRWVTHRQNIRAGVIRREKETGQLFLLE